MLSKNKIKYIRSLELKKIRAAEKVFVAEGNKLVPDLLKTFSCRLLTATPEWLAGYGVLQAEEVIEATQEELNRASSLMHPQQVIAVFDQPDHQIGPELLNDHLCLALDGIQDPGNLGTIIRLADWFGIEYIFCSPNTADIFNPKVIQASMGGIAHIKIAYTSLDQLIESAPGTSVYGTFLEGDNLYTTPLQQKGLIIMGNEGNGISGTVAAKVNRKLYIPNYPAGRETTESLNVAMATGIICAEFRRRGQFRKEG